MVNKPSLSHPSREIRRADFRRWFRQFFYMPWLTTRKFDTAAHRAIEAAVATAEAGHAGEIRVVIEAHLPLNTALYQTTVGRARHLFASLSVWDTAQNSGVLLYVNLCEHRVEIVADRGINEKIERIRWQFICQQMTEKMSEGKHQQAVVLGIELIGATLNEFYTILDVNADNELSNAVILMK